MRNILVFLVTLFLLSCSSSTSAGLRIIVRVTATEAIEFDTIQVRLEHVGRSSVQTRALSSETEVREGLEIATFPEAAREDDRLYVATLKGTQVLSISLLTLDEGQEVVELVLSPGCTQDSCKQKGCESAKDCSPSIECAAVACVDNTCKETLEDSRCAMGGECAAGEGCVYSEPVCGDGIVTPEIGEVCDTKSYEERCSSSGKQCFFCDACKQESIRIDAHRRDGNGLVEDVDEPCTIVSGIAARPVDLWERRTFDDRGNRTFMEGGVMEGDVGYAFKHEYDADDRLTVFEGDYNGDGMFTQRGAWSYDEEGNVLSDFITAPDIATPSRPFGSITYTRDEDGKILTKRTNTSSGMFFDSYSYNGELVSKTERRRTEGGPLTQVTDYVYENSLLREVIVTNAETDSVSFRTTYEYDMRGRRTALNTFNSTGQNSARTWSYDGDKTIFEWYSFPNGNRTIRRRTTSIMDVVIRTESDETLTGGWTLVQTHSYDPSMTHLLETKTDADGDGLFEEVKTFEYNDVFKVLSETSRDGNGTLINRTEYERDSRYNVVRKNEDRDGDGTYEWVTAYTVDEHGRPTASRKTVTGIRARESDMSYACYYSLIPE